MRVSRVAIIVLAGSVVVTPWLTAEAGGERDKAIAEIKKLKGTIVTFPFSVSFDGRGVGDDALEHLAKLSDLEAVYLRQCKVTDDGLAKLSGLTKLKYLYLGDTSVTDKGLEHLKGLTKLQSLSLVGTQVSDAGLTHLKSLRELRVLETKGSKITAAGITELKKSLPKLVVR